MAVTLEELFTHHDRVVKFIKGKCKNCHDAEDFVQDAYVRTAGHLEKLDSKGAYAWLCTVVINLWKDSLTSKKPLDKLFEPGTGFNKLIVGLERETDGFQNGFAYESMSKDMIDRAYARGEGEEIDIKEMKFQFSDKVLEVLDSCTELERKVFEHRYLLGYSYPDIKKALHIKPWQVKSSLHIIKLKMIKEDLI